MTMVFPVSDSLILPSISKGDSIRFRLSVENGVEWIEKSIPSVGLAAEFARIWTPKIEDQPGLTGRGNMAFL